MTGQRRNSLIIAQLAGVILTFASIFARSAQAQEHSPSSVPKAGTYLHSLTSVALGESLRFNNPFRLATPLGSSPESLSLTPPYACLGTATFLGKPNGLQHGLSIQWTRSLKGLPQNVLTPSYAILYGGARPWLFFSRLGAPVILNPDANVGGEAAVGAVWLFTAGFGLHAELVGNLFYGAETWDTGRTTIPMLSLQAGIVADFEVLP